MFQQFLRYLITKKKKSLRIKKLMTSHQRCNLVIFRVVTSYFVSNFDDIFTIIFCFVDVQKVSELKS